MESVYDPRRSKVPINSARFKDAPISGNVAPRARFPSRKIARKTLFPARLPATIHRRLKEANWRTSRPSVLSPSRPPLASSSRPDNHSVRETDRNSCFRSNFAVSARQKDFWKGGKIKRHVSRLRPMFFSSYIAAIFSSTFPNVACVTSFNGNRATYTLPRYLCTYVLFFYVPTLAFLKGLLLVRFPRRYFSALHYAASPAETRFPTIEEK